MKSVLVFLSLLLGLSTCTTHHTTRLLSPTAQQTLEAAAWETEYWSKQEDYRDSLSAKSKTRILVIQSDTLAHDRWYKKINVQPYGRYRVSGYIKTEGVQGGGAGFRLGKFPLEQDTVFSGDTDWTHVELYFDAEGDDSVLLECVLGKQGPAQGTVYFDRMQIEELEVAQLQPQVTLDFTRGQAPMSPYLYGQFIEHMGRCIYGGIWAELLQDRKFYHLPGTQSSPWTINTDTTDITIDTTHTYSRGAVPVFRVNGEQQLWQDQLHIEADKTYEGRIVFKAGPGLEILELSLLDTTQQWVIEGTDYQTIPFSFLAKASHADARLTIRFRGEGNLQLVAVSLMPADHVDGFRPDVLDLLRELNAPVYRWPGGNFVSGYDWRDGIGEQDKRPTRYERAWNGLEYNDVGVHEFMRLCELLDAEAFIAVNTGLGTASMAAQEVAYVNAAATTPMGRLRAQNGHEAPWQVRLWAVGNEMFGEWQLGHMPVEAYVQKHNRVAEAMQAADPEIELVAVGFPGNWNDQLYRSCLDNMDLVSEHFYRQDWHAGGLLTHVRQIPDAIAAVAEEHRRVRAELPAAADKGVKIALDEWNYWYGPHVYGLLGTRYFVRDALGIAAGFNEFSRQSDIYYMANYAQTVNVIGAIKTTPTSSWLETTGLVLKMYRAHFGNRPIAVTGVPAPLDVAATLTRDGQYCTISVINATRQPYALAVATLGAELSTAGQVYCLQAEDDMAYNDAAQPENVQIEQTAIHLQDGVLAIPPVSAGIYRFALR